MAQPVDLNKFAAALSPGSHELIALVGGGGKSTLLFALGRALRGEVVLTTTTKMGDKQTDGLVPLVGPTDLELAEALARHGRVLVRDRTEPGHGRRHGKAVGPSAATVDRWFDLADHLVVEADGSRQLPFKAPAEHEPVLATKATIVVAVIGADAIGRCIGDQCFRPLRVAAIAGCGPYERLTPERAAKVLISGRGSRKDVKADCRFVVAITKVAAANESLVSQTVEYLQDRDVEVITVADNT